MFTGLQYVYLLYLVYEGEHVFVSVLLKWKGISISFCPVLHIITGFASSAVG